VGCGSVDMGWFRRVSDVGEGDAHASPEMGDEEFVMQYCVDVTLSCARCRRRKVMVLSDGGKLRASRAIGSGVGIRPSGTWTVA